MDETPLERTIFRMKCAPKEMAELFLEYQAYNEELKEALEEYRQKCQMIPSDDELEGNIELH